MYTKSRLRNGLTLLTAPMKQTQAVTVLVLLPVGSRYEHKTINGASHFIEHLLFKGTERRPTSLDLTKELDAIGAEFNAFTGKDYTGYYIKTAAEHVELAFDMLSDMLFNSKFDPIEIDKERGVILEEIKMYEDNPLMCIEDIFEQTLFAGHPLGWNIAGPREVIKKITRQALVKYRDGFYQPNAMTVTVAGQCREQKVKALAEKYFGISHGRKSNVVKNVFTSQQTKPRATVIFKETEQVQMCLGLPAYPLVDKRMYALYLLSIILGGNMSSRLFINVREKHGLAYFIRSGITAYHDAGALVIQSGLDKGRITQAIPLILQELVQLRDHGVTAEELKVAKDFLKGKFVLSLEDSEHVADWLAKQQVLLGKVTTPEQRLKKIFAVTQKDIAAVAKDIMKPSLLNLALIGPFRNTKPFLKLLHF